MVFKSSLDYLVGGWEILLCDVCSFPQSHVEVGILLFDGFVQVHSYFGYRLVGDPNLMDVFLHQVGSVPPVGRILQAVVLVGHQLVVDQLGVLGVGLHVPNLHFFEFGRNPLRDRYQRFVDVLELQPRFLHHQVHQRRLSLIEIKFLIL